MTVFAIGEFDFDDGGTTGFGCGFVGCGVRGLGFADSIAHRQGFLGFAIPFGVVEVFVGFDEIVNREVIFAVKEASATTDDLFEFDHGVDGTH